MAEKKPEKKPEERAKEYKEQAKAFNTPEGRDYLRKILALRPASSSVKPPQKKTLTQFFPLSSSILGASTTLRVEKEEKKFTWTRLTFSSVKKEPSIDTGIKAFDHFLSISMTLKQEPIAQHRPKDFVGELARNIQLEFPPEISDIKKITMDSLPSEVESVVKKFAGDQLYQRIWEFMQIGVSGSGIYADMSFFETELIKRLGQDAQRANHLNLETIHVSDPSKGVVSKPQIDSSKHNIVFLRREGMCLIANFENAKIIYPRPKDVSSHELQEQGLLKTEPSLRFKTNMTVNFESTEKTVVEVRFEVSINFLPIFENEFEFEFERKLLKQKKAYMEEMEKYEKNYQGEQVLERVARSLINRYRDSWRKKWRAKISLVEDQSLFGDEMEEEKPSTPFGDIGDAEKKEQPVPPRDIRVNAMLRKLIVDSVYAAQSSLIMNKMVLSREGYQQESMAATQQLLAQMELKKKDDQNNNQNKSPPSTMSSSSNSTSTQQSQPSGEDNHDDEEEECLHDKAHLYEIIIEPGKSNNPSSPPPAVVGKIKKKPSRLIPDLQEVSLSETSPASTHRTPVYDSPLEGEELSSFHRRHRVPSEDFYSQLIAPSEEKEKPASIFRKMSESVGRMIDFGNKSASKSSTSENENSQLNSSEPELEDLRFSTLTSWQ